MLTSCSDEGISITSELQAEYILSPLELAYIESESRESTILSKDEAVEIASLLFAEKRGNKSDKIASASAVAYSRRQYANLKSEPMDTLMYIVNFDDRMGYAVVAADTRCTDVILAYASEGQINDNREDDGFELFLDMAADYVINSIIDYENVKDSISTIVLKSLDGLAQINHCRYKHLLHTILFKQKDFGKHII